MWVSVLSECLIDLGHGAAKVGDGTYFELRAVIEDGTGAGDAECPSVVGTASKK